MRDESETKKQKPVQDCLLKGTSDTFWILTGSSKELCEMETKQRSIYYLLLSSTDQEWLYSVERREPSYIAGGNVN